MPPSHVIAEIQGHAGLITLNRANALNALSLAMVRDITAALLAWRDDPAVLVVGIRGMGRDPATKQEVPFGAFCAGGDIRFFHQAALAGNPVLEDFFTEEYTLNHLVHTYAKPIVVFMDGIVMGGGMGIAQGARVRIATERTKMAMPETNIGLFPDVGGGFFLSRCPGHLGEYLALTGHLLDGQGALHAGLADRLMPSADLPALWASLGHGDATPWQAAQRADPHAHAAHWEARIDHYFAHPHALQIVRALEADAATDDWAATTAKTLRQRSPLMLEVTLQQVRHARGMSLAEDLRMERDLVRHCFHTAHLQRSGAATEVAEGVRALAVDKDHAPKWNPARLEDVAKEMVQPFFDTPWPSYAHPLRALD
jgi:enoyl-CoA hydratase/carnithine racemase